MKVKFKASQEVKTKPIVKVLGVGGAGGNAVGNMIQKGIDGLDEKSFGVANTDAQSLARSVCKNRIQLGADITKGLGAGAEPEVGAAAAEESTQDIANFLEGADMVFIASGMGGGTGTGSSPVISRIAKEMGILTIGVVTEPFFFEGACRMETAQSGLEKMKDVVDALIVISNQRLFCVADECTTFNDAFKMADEVLHTGVRDITDLMTRPGLVNLDFADIRKVMSVMGKAMMGTGEAGGEERAIKAAEAAISNPLLAQNSMKGARAVLINISGSDITLFEVDSAANRIRDEVGDKKANIIFGSTFNPELDGVIRVSVIATGIDGLEEEQKENDDFSSTSYKTGGSAQEEQESREEELPASSGSEEAKEEGEGRSYADELFDDQVINNSKNDENDSSGDGDDKIAAIDKEKVLSKKPAKEQKPSFFSKMWSSLTATEDSPSWEYNPQDRAQGSGSDDDEDNKDIPTFLRKKK